MLEADGPADRLGHQLVLPQKSHAVHLLDVGDKVIVSFRENLLKEIGIQTLRYQGLHVNFEIFLELRSFTMRTLFYFPDENTIITVKDGARCYHCGLVKLQ